MNLAPVLKQRFFDANGLPLSGGLLYSYAAGTTTPQATYAIASGTANTNPVVLDSSGYADVWLDPTLAYKFVLQDSGGSTIFTEDNVTFPQGITTWNANTVYGQGALALDTSGQGLIYVSLAGGNQNNALTNVSAWRVFGGNIRALSTSTTLAVTDDFVRSNSTAGNLTMTLPPCSTTPLGKRIAIKDVGTGGNSTSVKGSGTDLVDGTNTFGIALILDQSATFQNNGTSWDVVSQGGSVTTAMIADSAVTQAKIAANAVTRAKLSSVGQQVSASCGSFSTTSSSYVDVTNLSVTITTTGRPVVVFLEPDGTVTSTLVGASTANTGAGFNVKILRGATAIYETNPSTGSASSGAVSVRYPPGSVHCLDVPAAGTYTYKVQMHNQSISTCTASAFNCVLVAYEL